MSSFWLFGRNYPQYIYIQKLPISRVHLYTFVQLVCLGILYGLKEIKACDAYHYHYHYYIQVYIIFVFIIIVLTVLILDQKRPVELAFGLDLGAFQCLKLGDLRGLPILHGIPGDHPQGLEVYVHRRGAEVLGLLPR